MNGAADQATNAILFDRKGFLWSGTETGLYRFDGVRYVEYRSIAHDSIGYVGSLVASLFEDSDGILWVGTIGALNRLDLVTGRFTHYYPDQTGEFPVNNIIRLIKEDTSGLLWIKTNGNIYSFDKNTSLFTEYLTPQSSWREPLDVFGEEPYKFLIDRAGNIWSATGKGLFCIGRSDNKLKVIIPSADVPELELYETVNCVTEDYSGNIWYGTSNGGLFRIPDRNSVPERINFDPDGKYRSRFADISAILHENDGTVWIFGNSSFMHLDPSSGKSEVWVISYERSKKVKYPTSELIATDVFVHPDGSIWMFNKWTGAIIRFDRVSEKASFYRIPFYIEFRCIMDPEGSLWVASIRNNIFRLSTGLKAYETIYIPNGSFAGVLSGRKVAYDNKGNIWTRLSEGVFKIQIKDKYASPQLEKLKITGEDSIFSSVLTDHLWRLWLGERNGRIVCLDSAIERTKKYRLEHPLINMNNESVQILFQDDEKNIWAVTPMAGAYRLDESKGQFLQVFDFNSLPVRRSSFSDFLLSGNGEMWIVFIDRVFRVDPENKRISDYSTTSYKNKLVSGYYSKIREDIHGNIWLLNSHNGLYLFDREKDSFIPYLPGGKRLGLFCYDILTDTLGRLWITDNEGIKIYDPSAGNSRLIRISRSQFDIQGYKIPGHIVYINDNEMYLFKHYLPMNNTAPSVYIIKLEINGQSFEKVLQTNEEISAVKELKLRHNQNSLRIEFTGINYIEPKANTYFYYMDGVDDDTISSGTVNFAEYKKLRPGTYRFWVSSANNDGIRNEDGKNIVFNINKPFYRTAIAYLLYTTLVILIILTYIRWRLNNVRKENIRLENEVNNRTAELKIKNKLLENADRMKTKFFTDISHEIRTPLSLILGPLDSLINEYHYEPATENLLEIMRRNGHRLMQLVTQMLDISRLDSGKMKIVLSESDLTVFLRLLVYEFVSLAESRKIKYLVEIPDKSHIVLFDEDKLEKIITNLITNAFKYTEPGGTIKFSAGIIPSGMKGMTENFVFKVSDTGEGIDSNSIDRIFERYYRVEAGGHDLREGTGVGLSLVKELVTLCHGTIEVDSRKGEGSVFEVTIPLGNTHLLPDEFIIAQHIIKTESHEQTGRRKTLEPVEGDYEPEHERHRIMVIEDNDDLRDYLSANLEQDYSVISSANGKEGLSLCLTLVPDLVVTDIMMKDLDGIALCEKLKNDERTSHIPVVMLTAKSTMDDKIEGLMAGADDYLVKPFNITELRTRISNLLIQRDRLKHKYSNLLNINLKEDEKESVDDRFMRKVISILNDNIHDFDFNVKSLQEKLGMSRTHLFRKLKVLTGMGPIVLIRKLRMEKAARLLLSKSGNITEISNSVGISNPSYFTRCFREYFGMSPKDYLAEKGIQ